MKYNFGEMDQFYDFFMNLKTSDEQKYFLYLLKHSSPNIKDYVSRLNKIKKFMSYQFILNKEYTDIPGCSNFISCNGRYIINESVIHRIVKDIKDIYLFSKRSKKFKDVDIEKRIDILKAFMEYILYENKIVINKRNITSYLDNLSEEKDKNEFIEVIKWYSEIKNIDLDYDEEEIQKLDELEQEYILKLEQIKEMKKKYANI